METKRDAGLRRASKLFTLIAIGALAMGCWLSAVLLLGASSSGLPVILLIAFGVFVWIWSALRQNAKVWTWAGIVALVAAFLPGSVLDELADSSPQPVEMLAQVAILGMPAIPLVIAALLVYTGITQYQERRRSLARETANAQAQNRPAGSAALYFALCALLIAKTLDNLYWATVWDATYDPLTVFLLIAPILAVLYSGVMLAVTLTGKARMAGFVYAVGLLALLVLVSVQAQGVDFRRLTEERAGQISQAIDTFYAREHHYPQDLQQLTPWYLLSVPEPVIIRGQDWCYDAGEDYARLGYVSRDHWSSPIFTGKVYQARGLTGGLGPICKKQIAALQKRYPGGN